MEIFCRQFELASRSRDSTATSRFFKLFPAIGWETEGLKAYASFVVDLVRVRTPTSAKSTFIFGFRLHSSTDRVISQHLLRCIISRL